MVWHHHRDHGWGWQRRASRPKRRGISPGPYICATATDPAGNTSEFSQCVTLTSLAPGKTFTVLNVNDSGPGSLRQAILDSNGFNTQQNTIQFNILGAGVHTIAPLSPLPPTATAVLIDGYSQPGSSVNTSTNADNAVLRIELNGSLASSFYGLSLRGGNSIVRGLAINQLRDK